MYRTPGNTVAQYLGRRAVVRRLRIFDLDRELSFCARSWDWRVSSGRMSDVAFLGV
jgi:hypothetical protein